MIVNLPHLREEWKFRMFGFPFSVTGLYLTARYLELDLQGVSEHFNTKCIKALYEHTPVLLSFRDKKETCWITSVTPHETGVKVGFTRRYKLFIDYEFEP